MPLHRGQESISLTERCHCADEPGLGILRLDVNDLRATAHRGVEVSEREVRVSLLKQIGNHWPLQSRALLGALERTYRT